MTIMDDGKSGCQRDATQVRDWNAADARLS
jgi:hypothetical protein